MIVVDGATVDQVLAACEESAATMSSNLVALDSMPAFMLISHTTFVGATATRYGGTLALVPSLWERASAYATTVGEARRLRDEHRWPGGERLRDVEQLLTAPVIAVGQLPKGAAHVCMADLAASVDRDYQAVVDAVHDIDALWQEQLPALHAMAERLGRATSDALALKLEPRHEVRDLPDRVRAALVDVTTDPVGHAPVTRDLGVLVDQVVIRLANLTTQREQLPSDLAAARQRLVELRLLIGRGERARRRALERVREPVGLCDPIAPERLDGAVPLGLGPSLERVEALSGSWLVQRQALDEWSARATTVEHEAAAIARANEAPIAARDELRARLDAYRAMAGAHGAAEDQSLTALFDEAHDALHRPPADLRRAAPLVVRYVTAVRARVGAPSPRRSP